MRDKSMRAFVAAVVAQGPGKHTCLPSWVATYMFLQ